MPREEVTHNVMVRGPLSETLVIDDGEGIGQHFVAFDYPQTVDELYTVRQRFVEGQQIQVQEILQCFFAITDASLIDIDQTWYGNKQYLGSWRLNPGLVSAIITEEDEGFVTAQFFSIVRYSSIVVVPRRGVVDGIFGSASIDDCNFTLAANPAAVGDLLENRSRLRSEKRVQLFTADTSVEYHFLDEAQFFPRITTCGFYTPPGARLSSVNYTRGVINEVPLLRPPVGLPTDCLPFGSACDILYDAFVTGGGTYAPFPTLRDAIDFITANATGTGVQEVIDSIISLDFPCPDGSVRPYFQAQGLIG